MAFTFATKVWSMTKTTRQTVRINGKRTIIKTRNGKVTTTPALPREWELQAAQCRRLRNMPEYGKLFLLAADMNAGKRGPRAQVEAIASGMTPGEPDLRIYISGGRLGMIENKVDKGRLRPDQVTRHADLIRLGFDVRVVSSVTEADAADQAEALVRGWLLQAQAQNDNKVVDSDCRVFSN